MAATRHSPEVREFILRNVENHPADIGTLTGEKFGLSRTTVSNYMRRIEGEGLIRGEGKTKGRRYKLEILSGESFTIALSRDLAEDEIFRVRVLPLMLNVKQNIVDICQYGFTEMFNNACDHSGSSNGLVSYEQTYTTIKMIVSDGGVGIFEKIQQAFNLADPRSALLELSKGKLTSDKTRHSGEGIFFTSRMFDDFCIRSGHLFYTRERGEGDYEWLIETHDVSDYRQGTVVQMVISTAASWTTREIFDFYQQDDILFRRTHVPVKLGRYPGEQLVSRSQAKRILARFNEFSEVLLDFNDVAFIGQPFADEIFRVFANAHPGTKVVVMRTSPDVQKMINFVEGAAQAKS